MAKGWFKEHSQECLGGFHVGGAVAGRSDTETESLRVLNFHLDVGYVKLVCI